MQDTDLWTQESPSTAILGLKLITALLILILILDAVRNQISIHLKQRHKIKKDKEEKLESEQKWIISKTEESDSLWNITGLTIWNEEKEPPEYEATTNNNEEDRLLTIEEKNHPTEQEIKDLQGTVKSLQKETTTHYPLMQN